MAPNGREGSLPGAPLEAKTKASSRAADASLAPPTTLPAGAAPAAPSAYDSSFAPARPSPEGQTTLPTHPDDSELQPPEGPPNRPDRADRPEAAAAAAFPASENGRYEFLTLLGRGGMGDVYKARDRRLGREVALKFLRDNDSDRTMRLLQEARAQARIEHPNVCKVYEVGEIAGKAYIAMQLVSGQQLDKAATGMSLPEKVRVMKLVAEAVHEAHRLGVVHRDLKPANVMVTRGVEGHFSPMVMDFGLAYEVSRGHGLTEAGALMGTPAYMAPEQARGEVHGVDVRSDVYSLGATLYEVLTGSPPFTASTSIALLSKVLHEEPKPLRAREPGLPTDLETVTLKCLQKEPGRRYPSAKALADDLGRYLEGEPVVGRRPGAVERLNRWSKKHKALVAVSALSLAATLSFAALGVRSWLETRSVTWRLHKTEEFGQQVNEIEWFLRSAYEMPLHDTSAEQQTARDRLKRIEASASKPGDPGEGFARYALGRGHLALGDFDRARAELERARAEGVDTPGLYYALGRALGEQYRSALDDARHGGGVAWVAERRLAVEKNYLMPALDALEKSRGVEIESPHYLEGLIAFYRRDYEAAGRAVRQAAEKTPWAYDARRLAGDVAYARAVDLLERGEYDGARQGLEEATSLYEKAAEVGRSDARAYEALAEAWLERSEVDQRQGRPRTEALDAALEAADKAVEASPLRASVHTRRARVLMQRYWWVKFQGEWRDPKPVLDAWLAAATRAVALDANDVYACEALGAGHFLRGLDLARGGESPAQAYNEAASWLTRALERQPNYPWALNDLAQVYRWRGAYEAERGLDPSASFAEAERHFRQAVGSDPRYLYAYVNLGDLYVETADYELSRGRDPEGPVRRALGAGEQSLSIDQRYYLTRNQMARAELTRARYLVERGGDPGPAAARAFEHLDLSSAINASFGRTPFYRALGHCLLAQNALLSGASPLAHVEAGRAALDEAYRRDEGCVDCRVTGARLGIIEADWARQRGQPSLPIAQRAVDEAKKAVSSYPHLDAHVELARAYARVAEAEARRAALDAADDGEAQIEKALKLDPSSGLAHAALGGLLMARSRATDDADKRAEVVVRARASLARAFELDPLLKREYEKLLR